MYIFNLYIFLNNTKDCLIYIIIRNECIIIKLYKSPYFYIVLNILVRR